MLSRQQPNYQTSKDAETVYRLFEEWVGIYRLKVKPTTAVQTIAYVRKFILAMQILTLDQINTKTIQQWICQENTGEIQPSGLSKRRDAVSSFIEWLRDKNALLYRGNQQTPARARLASIPLDGWLDDGTGRRSIGNRFQNFGPRQPEYYFKALRRAGPPEFAAGNRSIMIRL